MPTVISIFGMRRPKLTAKQSTRSRSTDQSTLTTLTTQTNWPTATTCRISRWIRKESILCRAAHAVCAYFIVQILDSHRQFVVRIRDVTERAAETGDRSDAVCTISAPYIDVQGSGAYGIVIGLVESNDDGISDRFASTNRHNRPADEKSSSTCWRAAISRSTGAVRSPPRQSRSLVHTVFEVSRTGPGRAGPGRTVHLGQAWQVQPNDARFRQLPVSAVDSLMLARLCFNARPDLTRESKGHPESSRRVCGAPQTTVDELPWWQDAAALEREWSRFDVTSSFSTSALCV